MTRQIVRKTNWKLSFIFYDFVLLSSKGYCLSTLNLLNECSRKTLNGVDRLCDETENYSEDNYKLFEEKYEENLL